LRSEKYIESRKRLSIRFCREESSLLVLPLNRDSSEKIAVIEKVVPSYINVKWISLLLNIEPINSLHIWLLLLFIVATLMGIIFRIFLFWLSRKQHLFRSYKKSSRLKIKWKEWNGWYIVLCSEQHLKFKFISSLTYTR